MEFVSKDQTFEAIRKLLAESAAPSSDPNMEDLARNMEMNDGKSRIPALYERFLDTITADPLSPEDALCAASEFLEKNVDAEGKPQTAGLIQTAKAAAARPEDQPEFWNRWLTLLESV